MTSLLLCFWLTLLTLSNGFELTDKPPLLNVPTYSLATRCADGSSTNMNIVTYATPVSVRPERLWAIGLFKETQTHDNFLRERKGVLQLVTREHIPLIRLLGGKSGYDVNKKAECESLGFIWLPLRDSQQQEQHQEPLVLPRCASYLELECVGDPIDGGSHVVCLSRVVSMHTDSTSLGEQISTSTLRDLGIITEQGRIAW